MRKIVFTPDNHNYKKTEGEIPVKILKNMVPENPPEGISANCVKITHNFITFRILCARANEMEFSKDGGKIWQNFAEFTGNAVQF